jgi:chromosome segregation ATPase
LFERGDGQARFMIPLKARVRKYETEVKQSRADILELQGLQEQDRAEMEGLREDLAVCNAGYDAEREEKAKVESERDDALKQLEFLEAELEGVRETEATLRAENKAQAEELADVTSARDELDDEVRRLKELGNAREIELSKLRSTLTDLRVQHSAALDDVNRYRADAERQGERAGKLAAQTSAAMSEADKLRKWQDWAKASEVTSLRAELETCEQERDMLRRDLHSRLAEMKRVASQNEEWGKDVKALRADLFAREGRLGRVEAELAALQRHATRTETDLSVAREQAQRRAEELQVASMDAVKLRGKFETERLKNQSAVTTLRAHHNTELIEMKTAHAAEMEAARRDAAAAWRLAKELETRVTTQAKMFTANNKKFSKALEIGRRLTGEEPKPPSTPVDLT